MSILDRVRSIFAPRATAQQTSTADEMAAQVKAREQRTAKLYSTFAADAERQQVLKTCRKMYKADPRARGIIKTLARDAVKGGFVVKVANNPQAEQIANDLVKRLKLVGKLDDYARLTIRDGDSFLQLGITADNRIGSLSRLATLQMRRNSNSQDRFDDPERAFWFGDEHWFGDEPPADAIWFAEWQVIHARWDHDEENRYGSPLFESATSAYKRVSEGEMDIAVRRKTRAGMKYLHVIENADDGAIEAYKENNKDALDNPFAAVADFFTNKQGAISTIQGDARLSEIEDVKHHIRTWWLASPVPMSLLGYGEDLNRDVLQEQKEQYDRALESVTGWLEAEIVVPLLERQWLLAGILPEGLDYAISWKSKGVLSAAELKGAAEAALALKALGFSDDVILPLLSKFLPDVDIDEMMTASDSDRMAATADDFLNSDGDGDGDQ